MFRKNGLSFWLMAFSLLLVAVTLSLRLTGYSAIAGLLRERIGSGRDASRFDSLFTPAAFSASLAFFLLLAIVLAILGIWHRQPGAPLHGLAHEIWRQLVKTLSILRHPGYAILVTVPALASFYLAWSIPVGYDEAITYNVFTTHHPLVSLAYYPFPNNHILHSFLTSIGKFLPLPALLALRLPAWLAQVLAWIVFLRLLHETLGEKKAIIAMAISSALFFGYYYGFMSRGYALVNLCFIASLYCAKRIMTAPGQPKPWTFLTLISAVGFWTMPSFLYPFVSIHLLIFLHTRKHWLSQCLSGAGTILLVCLAYAPVVIVNGIAAIAGNKYVQPVSRSEVWDRLPGFLLQSLSEISGFPWALALPVLLIAALYVLFYAPADVRRSMIYWSLIAPVLLWIHGVIPYPRTFAYYGFLMGMLMAWPLSACLDKIPFRIRLVTVVLIQLALFVNFLLGIEAYEERDPQLNFTADRVVRKIMGPEKTYLCAGALVGTNLLYTLKSNKWDPGRIHFQDNAVNADTVQHTDYVIIGTYLDSTVHRQPMISNFYYRVYGPLR